MGVFTKKMGSLSADSGTITNSKRSEEIKLK
jgi:hypothetical protein